MIKDNIADAFQRYFHQFGFKKTSVDDVAHEMQISKKTIYQHFSSKEEILHYVIQRNAQVILGQMIAQIRQDGDEARQLDQLIHLIHKVANDFQRSNVASEFQFRMEIAEEAYHQAYSKIIADLITAGVQKSVFHCIDLNTTIHYVDLIVTESLRLTISHPEESPEEETLQAVQKILG